MTLGQSVKCTLCCRVKNTSDNIRQEQNPKRPKSLWVKVLGQSVNVFHIVEITGDTLSKFFF